MSLTLDDFPVMFYDDDPNGAGSGQFKGVMCSGTCGAPCWQPAPAAVAAGETPTFDEVMESTATVLEGADETLVAAGNAAESDLDAEKVRALHMVQAALNGAGMVLNYAWAGDTTIGQRVDDYGRPARDLVRATRYYLEQAPPRTTPTATLATLARIRALAAQLDAELVALAGED